MNSLTSRIATLISTTPTWSRSLYRISHFCTTYRQWSVRVGRSMGRIDLRQRAVNPININSQVSSPSRHLLPSQYGMLLSPACLGPPQSGGKGRWGSMKGAKKDLRGRGPVLGARGLWLKVGNPPILLPMTEASKLRLATEKESNPCEVSRF